MRRVTIILSLGALLSCGDDPIELADAGEDTEVHDVDSDGSSPSDVPDADPGDPDGGMDVADFPDAQTDSAAPELFVSECLARGGPRETISGPQLERFRRNPAPDGAVFDASSAEWSGLDADGEPIPWTIGFRGDSDGACWYGGIIRGPWDDTAPGITWEDPYHHAGGITIEDASEFLVEGMRIDNQGDGIRPYGPDARIRAAYLTDIHDDCIENDDGYNLVVEDSLLDGCYVAFSARPFRDDAADQSANLWEIRNSLIRLEPQPTVYRGPSPGNGPFFKWDNEGQRSPRAAIHDNIFRLDVAPTISSSGAGIPESLEMESCSNNIMVWLGEGEFPGELPDCFTVVRDASVWDNARAEWLARHPDIR